MTITTCPHCSRSIVLSPNGTCPACREIVDEALAAEAPAAPKPTEPPELWNPTAAANLSVLFSPAFGAWALAKNWTTLGNEKSASANRAWMKIEIALLVVGAIAIIVAMFTSEEAESVVLFLLSFAHIIVLATWYFTSWRKHYDYVNTQLPQGFAKKSWDQPGKIALGLLVLWLVLFLAFDYLRSTIP